MDRAGTERRIRTFVDAACPWLCAVYAMGYHINSILRLSTACVIHRCFFKASVLLMQATPLRRVHVRVTTRTSFNSTIPAKKKVFAFFVTLGKKSEKAKPKNCGAVKSLFKRSYGAK
jgi:hypothetical protein